MSVWYAVPSARSDGGTLKVWYERGYKVAAWRDSFGLSFAAFNVVGKYPGYAIAVNSLVREILQRDAEAQWIVTGGDDVSPDDKCPETIAAECTAHFGGTFGVMQPTGDRWGEDPRLPNLHPLRSAYADRVCYAPWMGREFCARMYGGSGPLHDGYAHMFVDEELQAVAQRLGVLWQRRDLTHEHKHWMREKAARPAHLAHWSSRAHWDEAKAMFLQRQEMGFPGHEPIPA